MTLINSFYGRLFAPLFLWNLKRWHSDDDMAAWFTMAGLSGTSGAQILAIIALATSILGYADLPDWIGYAMSIAVIAANYFIFLHHSKYRHIVEQYLAAPDHIRRRQAIIAWSYVFGSIASPLLVLAGIALVSKIV